MTAISIIIPFINGEKYLKKCIENIQKQKYQDYEVIFVDDGSKDNSKQLISKYLKNPRLKYYYIDKNSIGVGSARNYGIEKATGKYLMFLDIDDYIDEDLLSHLAPYMEKNIDLIKYKMKIINLGKKEIKCIGPIFDIVTGEEGFNKLCFEDKFLDSPCLYLIKKELFKRENLRFDENMYHEDFALIPKLIIKAKSFVSMNYYGYYYVQTKESIMRNKNYNKTLKKTSDKFKIYKDMLNFLEKESLKNITNENMKIYYTNSIILSLNGLNKKDRKMFEDEIRSLHMIDNLRVNNVKQLVKKCILRTNINLYLKFATK